MVEVVVQRLSNMVDRIPLLISERLIDVTENYIGRTLEAHGQFRSYNKHEEGRNRLVLSVFVREVEILEEEPENVKPNSIFLDGFICKQPSIPDDAAWPGNCGLAVGCQPAVWKI